MTRFSRLIRVCAWCQRLQDPPVSEPTAPGTTGTSHTICSACAERMRMEQAYKDLQGTP